jgi:2-polyprenyl-3-methyl-5-hydroxy-6-metoxy-1,4-benzoquinol methylase
MAPSHACGICAGPAELFLAGRAGGIGPEAFSPTCHRPGEHADLYRCADCGTVQQPGLPGGDELAALYREMEDDAYLHEEAGRRVAANQLLDLVAAHRPAGRLLDVGCGHGLLLDEARRRGFDPLGLELSGRAAAHARAALGLEVREETLEELAAADPAPFDAIVLADVVEHLEDPRRALDLCTELLAPGGVLCVVTPDPGSLTARLARSRWWGYLPAHTYLLPRRTLRELLSARGLIVTADVGLVRTFSLRYWLQGAGERSRLAQRLAAAAARAGVTDRLLSLPLGDERVIVAQRVEVQHAPEPLMRPRGGEHDVLVVLPAHNAAATVHQVAAEMPPLAADQALLVDDASTDATTEAALSAGFDVLRHPVNRGYGANQKSCYVRAALAGVDAVVMVHADNQYDPALVPDMVAPILAGRADVVLGSRMLEDRAIVGGMPRWKWVGNRFLTAIENRAFRRGFSEYHTGYRAFSVDFLRSIAFLRNSDGFVFDQEIFAQAVSAGARVEELAIPTRYFLEASSVSFRTSVEYGLRTLYVLGRFRLAERGRRWAPLAPPAARLAPQREAALER